MRISTIFRILSQVIFWFTLILFAAWTVKFDVNIPICLLTILITILACYMARRVKKPPLYTLAHLLCVLIPAVPYYTSMTCSAIMVIISFYVLMSYSSRITKSNSMDRTNMFHEVVIVIMYLIAVVGDYRYIYGMYALMCLFIFTYIVQCSAERNEKYVDSVVKTSVVDTQKMIRSSSLISISLIGIMMILSVSLSFIGKVGPLGTLSEFIKDKTTFITDSMNNIEFSNANSYVQDDNKINEPPGMRETDDLPNPGYTTEWTIAVVFTIVMTIVVILLAVFKVRRTKRYDIIQEEEISIFSKKENKEKKASPRRTDPFYGNRKAIRRIYKRRVKGGKDSKREDLETRTPHEQKVKVSQNGVEVSGEFVDMYEKARYSDHEVTKNDIKTMQNL